MASDFSSGCTEAVDVLDEKEEGEISLEDVSSSEEGHPNYGCNSKIIEQCPGCSSTQHCASWCTIAARTNRSRALHKKEVRLVPQDAVQGKENRHHSKSTGHLGERHTSSTLQEKNDDLIPISSDSDMELVGLAESTVRAKSSKVKKKRKKRRPRSVSLQSAEVQPNTHETVENITIVRHNPVASKENRLLKTHHRLKSPVHNTRPSSRRHRSPPVRVRPLPKKARSPVAHTKLAATRKSPRRLKSPRRSPYKSIVNPLHKKVRKHSSPSTLTSSPTNDVRFTKLLKKVRQLDMVGTQENDKVTNKTKEHGSSLKDKLSNILKTSSETSENTTNKAKEEEDFTEKNKKEKGEEEDDLNVLRQKALETKQSKTNKSQESLNIESDIKGSSNNEDDDDEDLQLRLIALRSAVYKKHHNRIQRREKSKKKSPLPRTVSPFSDSFINIVTDVENDESPLASPKTSSAMKDCMSLEDMELDSDLERGPDLDDAPYSPTDEVNSELILEAEQLGLDATDVSLININSQVRFSSPLISSERETTPSTPSLGNLFGSSSYSSMTLNSDLGYPTSQSTISSESPPKDPQNRIPNEERPYSPSDTPVYDPDLSYAFLPQNGLNSNHAENLKHVNNLGVNNLHSRLHRPVGALEIDKVNLPTDLTSHSANSMMSNGIITIDDFPDTDLDGSPLVPMEQDSGPDYHIPEHLSYQMLQPSYQPLYLRNSPNLMNDVNQMPTLINKPLIPAPVARLNNLHQEPKKPPLFTRIQETQESIFQSASDLKASNSIGCFKPIKLPSLPKKQVTLNTGIFDQFRGRSMPNISENEIDKRMEESQKYNLTLSTPEEEMSDSNRKRKRIRKKRRSSKKSLTELEEITNSVDQEKSTKRLKPVEIESRNEKIVQPNSVDVVNNSKDNKVEKNSERNLELNLVHTKKQLYDPHRNNMTIIANWGTTTINKNDGELSLSNNNIKVTDTDSKSIEGARRRSIDEDEEALRASLLASLANRTKSAEIVIPNPIKPVTKNPETVPSKPATAAPKVAVIEKANNATLNKPTKNIQTRQTLPAASKKNINLNVSVASGAKSAPKVPVNNSESTNSILGKRRSSSVQVASPKKIAKKAVIPASIKVVNNAKRYQNSLMQKRLNSQKANTVFNASKIIANRSLRVLNRNQNTRPLNQNASAFKNGERFIISLHSDSDSDLDSEQENSNVAVARKSSVEKCQPLTIPTTEFERSVEQFLREVRKKQELAAANKPANLTLVKKQVRPAETPPKKGKVTLASTPLAVRHLPASQQEEYHRLKQQILEREKLKLQRTSNSQQSSNTNTVTPPGSFSPAEPSASSKQKAVSAIVTNNLPKALSDPKCSSVKNLPASSSSNSILTSQKQNLSIQIRNDGVSPTRVSTLSAPRNSPNTQNSTHGNTQGNSQDLSKPSMPKLRILTCEQVNMKFLQVQVNQKEGRKVIVGDINSPQKNISYVQRSELVNQNMSKKEAVRVENNSTNTNESLLPKKSDMEAVSVIISKSNVVDKTYDSEASTVVLSNSDVTVINESRVNRTIDSEASTLVLSQSNVTPTISSDSPSNSTARFNISKQKTFVDVTAKGISKKTPDIRSIPPTATSTVLKAPVVKEAAVTKEATVVKEATVTKDAAVLKAPISAIEAIISKGSVVRKENTISQEPTVTKVPTGPEELTVTKNPAFTKAPNIQRESATLNLQTEKTTVNCIATSSTITLKSNAAVNTEKVMPSTSEENIQKKRITEKTSKITVNSEASSTFKSTEPGDKEQSMPSTSRENLKRKTATQKADKEKCNEAWDEIKDNVLSEVEKILMLNKEEQKRKLVEVEQDLVAKRYVVLDDLAAVSGSLRQWEIEKDLQANFAAEVRKLREQLREAEERLKKQKERAASMGAKVAAVHEKMNFGRKECYRIAKICTGLGTQIFGRKYKIPEAGVQLVNNRLKEVAQHTSQLCKKNEKKSKISESTEKSEKKESEATSDERENNIERQNSCESFASCGRDSNSVSSEMFNSPEVENNQEDFAQKENEPNEIQVSYNSEIVFQPIMKESSQEKKNEESSMDSCEKADNNDNSKNTDFSSTKNTESIMCHTTVSSTQNQRTKSDEQSSKQTGRPYESILTHLRTPRSSQPDGILCPYQLMGSCHDGECQFIHHPSQ